MSSISQLYDVLGPQKFSKKLCEIVPYFATIAPEFEELKPGYAKVRMANTPQVHNHIGTVHAIAMCNLAETAAGLLTDVSIPKNYRWIPTGLRSRYLAKATTDLVAIADGRELDWQQEGELDVPVAILDANGVEVCSVFVSVLIGKQKE